MAFHGSRGRGSGSGPPRGRGGARGGNRGRGGFRGGKRPIFDSARVAAHQKEEYDNFLSNHISETQLIDDREEQQKSESENPSDVEAELESDSDSSDEEDAPLPATHSYAALMQSLASESAPQPKRRKLEHPTESSEAKESPASDFDVVEQGEDADVVDEEEEGPETAIDGLLEDSDDEEDASDPFEAHFADPEDNLLAKRLKAVQANSWITTKTVLPKFGKVVMNLPQTDVVSDVAVPPAILGPHNLKLKQKLAGVISKQKPNFDPLERSIAAYMFNYQDILYCERDPVNSDSLRRLACLHAVNHVFK